MDKFYIVSINAVVSFLVLFFIAKILGKKQVAELSFTDYVVGISLGSIAAEWAIDFDTPWYFFAIPIAIYLFLTLFIVFLGRSSPILKKLLNGSPLTVISDGRIDFINLQKSKLSVNNLLGMCRNKGVFDIQQIEYAIFETTGDLSIMVKPQENNSTNSDKEAVTNTCKIPTVLIIDGRICYDELNLIGKTKKWLLDNIDNPSKKELKGILLATYKNEKVLIQLKNQQTFSQKLK